MFSMPFFSVMVEDGQPAQEPRMCRKTMPVAVVEALEDDVAAVLRHRRAHARFDQFLDLGDDFGIAFAVRRFVGLLRRRLRSAAGRG